MFDPAQYQLLDFGQGRKLERFGPYLIDRPAPVAEEATRSNPSLWREAAARYERLPAEQQGTWAGVDDLPATWSVRHGHMHFELKCNEFGHVGLFPEQAANWDWIAEQVRAAGRPLKILNLFAYTGGSTLAAAAAGASVVHVDAARNVVAWARRNAAASGLADAPIRWIAEDARKFVRREIKRGNRYDAVIVDPPSYGHGPRGEVWSLNKHLHPLLCRCAHLTAESRTFVLVTCHTSGIGPADLGAYVSDAFFGSCGPRVRCGTMKLTTPGGRNLPSGVVASWTVRDPMGKR